MLEIYYRPFYHWNPLASLTDIFFKQIPSMTASHHVLYWNLSLNHHRLLPWLPLEQSFFKHKSHCVKDLLKIIQWLLFAIGIRFILFTRVYKVLWNMAPALISGLSSYHFPCCLCFSHSGLNFVLSTHQTYFCFRVLNALYIYSAWNILLDFFMVASFSSLHCFPWLLELK